VGGTWWLFNRRTEEDECPGRGPKLGLQVRRSDDRGATWGEPTTILAPEAGTPWACAATDGDAVFDRGQGTWRYLFQCLDEQAGWSGCYAERRDSDPRGEFSSPAGAVNPVIPPGSLWSRVCDDPGDRCHRPPDQKPIADEGTFSLLPASGGGWWVGFHGSDGTQGFRGLGRTSTFRRDEWQVDGEAGTPPDVVIDASDATAWRESWRPGGPIGAGAAGLVEQDGWYYQVAEVADVSLSCRADQSWDLGLFRSRQPASTRWDQFPGGNPVVYSSRAPEAEGKSAPCNVQYPGLFTDPGTGTTYLMHGRASADPAYDAIYLYRLEWDRNRLGNGDFRRADALGWAPLPNTVTQLAVERDPDESPDGTPDLVFNCGGGSCDAGQGVFQDVSVQKGDAGRMFAFGGSFKGSGAPGELDVGVLQLDGSGRVVETTTISVAAKQTYSRARGTVEVDERAARLRFQLMPRSPGTLRADNLYVIPQQGCTEPRYPSC
jgi:hypothetical protein